MRYKDDDTMCCRIRVPQLLLHSDDVSALTFRKDHFVNITFGGDMRIPQSWVIAAYRFILNQIKYTCLIHFLIVPVRTHIYKT